MRQNTKKKRSGFGYFIRMFLLLVELLAVTLFLWGNDAYSISATTPEFKWEIIKRSHMHWEGLVINLSEFKREFSGRLSDGVQVV